ncbi:hypothetical protein BC936DRAFT_137715, partial [Jimgerdemannia flammicorona]
MSPNIISASLLIKRWYFELYDYEYNYVEILYNLLNTTHGDPVAFYKKVKLLRKENLSRWEAEKVLFMALLDIKDTFHEQVNSRAAQVYWDKNPVEVNSIGNAPIWPWCVIQPTEEDVPQEHCTFGIECGRQEVLSEDDGGIRRTLYSRAPERLPDCTLYIPKAFNFKAIDGVLLSLEVKDGLTKAIVISIQITIADSHSDSVSKFFDDWNHWNRQLKEYTEVSIYFVWIMEKVERRIVDHPMEVR